MPSLASYRVMPGSTAGRPAAPRADGTSSPRQAPYELRPPCFSPKIVSTIAQEFVVLLTKVQHASLPISKANHRLFTSFSGCNAAVRRGSGEDLQNKSIVGTSQKNVFIHPKSSKQIKK